MLLELEIQFQMKVVPDYGTKGTLIESEIQVRAVLNSANGKLPANGLFKDVPVIVSGQTVYLRGNVVNGVPRLGTMFIP